VDDPKRSPDRSPQRNGSGPHAEVSGATVDGGGARVKGKCAVSFASRARPCGPGRGRRRHNPSKWSERAAAWAPDKFSAAAFVNGVVLHPWPTARERRLVLALASALVRFVEWGEGRIHPPGFAYPGTEALAEASGLRGDALADAKAALWSAGFLTVLPRTSRTERGAARAHAYQCYAPPLTVKADVRSDRSSVEAHVGSNSGESERTCAPESERTCVPAVKAHVRSGTPTILNQSQVNKEGRSPLPPLSSRSEPDQDGSSRGQEPEAHGDAEDGVDAWAGPLVRQGIAAGRLAGGIAQHVAKVRDLTLLGFLPSEVEQVLVTPRAGELWPNEVGNQVEARFGFDLRARRNGTGASASGSEAGDAPRPERPKPGPPGAPGPEKVAADGEEEAAWRARIRAQLDAVRARLVPGSPEFEQYVEDVLAGKRQLSKRRDGASPPRKRTPEEQAEHEAAMRAQAARIREREGQLAVAGAP
jgi:hypothetical protein